MLKSTTDCYHVFVITAGLLALHLVLEFTVLKFIVFLVMKNKSFAIQMYMYCLKLGKKNFIQYIQLSHTVIIATLVFMKVTTQNCPINNNEFTHG